MRTLRQARLDAPGVLNHIMIRFWAVSELGMSLRELARRLEMSRYLKFLFLPARVF